jgi:hypothetical protein
MRQLIFAIALAATACGSYRPARFADRAAVTRLGDDRPIALPSSSVWIEPVHLSELYLKRPLLNVLDAERFPYARDVNALDEVPSSSFWDPPPLEPSGFERAYAGSALGEVLIEDPRHQPGTRSAAAVIASRLVRAVGYRTPAVTRVSARVAAMHWPPGIELGPTDPTGTRSDDPNDRIAHRDRRTLRALGLLAAWLDLRDLGPKRVVDVYVGAAPRGHVQHFLLGLDGSLGAAWFSSGGRDDSAVGVVRGGTLENLVTLGLGRLKKTPAPSEPSLRALSPTLNPDFQLAHPWHPSERLLPSDGYWMSKRIARIPRAFLQRSVLAAKLDPAVSQHLVDALESRRSALVAGWLGAVTPLELVACESRKLWLADEAIRLGFASDSAVHYRVAFIDDHGQTLAPTVVVRPESGRLQIELPERALARDYFVVRVIGIVGRKPAPRAFEAHLSTRGRPHVVGIRH